MDKHTKELNVSVYYHVGPKTLLRTKLVNLPKGFCERLFGNEI